MLKSSNSVLISTGTLVFGYLFQDKIKQITNSVLNFMSNIICSSITINVRGSEKLVYGIQKELENIWLTKARNIIAHGDDFYTLNNGRYYFRYKYNIIFIDWSENQIILWIAGLNVELIKEYINYVEKKYNKKDDVIIYYLIDNDKWGNTLYRRPSDYSNITNDMKNMMNDIDLFFTQKKLYKKNSWPYRKGYIIEGNSGTGKSTIVNVISSKYNMCIYKVVLNCNGLDGNKLTSLINKVPPRSLIVFDEMDKQYESISLNPNVKIFDSDILSAIDGPMRLSHGTIVIMTLNDINKIKSMMPALTRKGRMDQSFKFNDLYV